MKKNQNDFRWNVDDDKVFWAATAIILALLVVCLCGCKVHKESQEDYRVNVTETVQEHSAEGSESLKAVSRSEIVDTIRETHRVAGHIDIERDSLGLPLGIFYEHLFDGFRAQGSSRVDTVEKIQVVMVRDSVGLRDSDSQLEGRSKNRTDAGFSLLGLSLFCVVICAAVLLLYWMVRRYVKGFIDNLK